MNRNRRTSASAPHRSPSDRPLAHAGQLGEDLQRGQVALARIHKIVRAVRTCEGQGPKERFRAWLRKYVECVPGATYVNQALRSGSNSNYPETVPFGSSSDLK